MTKRFLIFAVLLTFIQLLKAQQNQMFFHFGMEDGLSGNFIQKVQQDNDGYLWVLSNIGLQRFDGIRFTEISGESGAIPAGKINEILIDKKNRLWIYFQNNSIGYLNPRNLKWRWVNLEGSGQAPTIFESNEGKILLCFRSGKFFTLNEATQTFSEKNNFFHLPQDWRFITLSQDSKNNFWIGTREGLVKFNPQKNTLSYSGHNVDNDPVIAMVGNLKSVQNFQLSNDGLTGWITAWPQEGMSFKQIDVENKKTKDLTAYILKQINNKYYTVHRLFESRETTWIYGETLLAQYNRRQDKVQVYQTSNQARFAIYYDVINDVFEDREQNLWIATDDGLYRYTPPSPFLSSLYNYLPHKDSAFTPDVTDILELSSGDLLVSTWGNGVFSYDRNFRPVASRLNESKKFKDAIMIWSMVEMPNNDIWMGAQDGWLWHYQSTKSKWISFQPELAQKSTIRLVEKDTAGNLWIGTQAGHIIRYDTRQDKWQLIHRSTGIISRIVVTPNNEIWAATYTEGVFRINGETGNIIAQYSENGPPGSRISEKEVNDVIQYNDSIILIASGALNVLNLRTSKISAFKTRAGIIIFEKDDSGIIWAATNIGLQGFSFPDFKEFISFDQAHGIDNFNFNIAASARLRNGSVVFGNSHGLITFDPAALLAENRKNKFENVLISEVFINEKKYPVDSLLALKRLKAGPEKVSIRIRYTTNTFRNHRTIYFKLEDVNADWQEMPSNQEVVLNYLPSGSYKLKTGLRNDNNEIRELNVIPIEIEPQFYESTWFYILMSLTALTVLFVVDRYRMKRREYIQEMRRNIARQLHADISSTLEKVNILSDIAILKQDNDPVKSKEFITEIKGRSSSMISAMQDMLWSISPENDSTEELVNRFDKYIKVLNNRHQSVFQMAYDEKVKHLSLNIELRYQLLLLFKRTLKAFISSGFKDLNIYIGCEKSQNIQFCFQFMNENENNRALINYLNSSELLEKLAGINGEITTSIQSKISEVVIKINL